MPLATLVILALIQGITEFLPVSSSGHLILFPALTGAEDQGLALDVAVHVGTLLAVILYFRDDVASLIRGGFQIIMGRFGAREARFALLLIFATIPVILFGVALKLLGLVDALRDIKVIAWAMLVFGVVLYWFDMRAPTTRKAADWNWRDALIMGLWQALALIPGTSRSGATITGSRQLGFSRSDGARLAMLMSIPTIIASGTLIGLDVARSPDLVVVKDLAIAAFLSFLAALAALKIMMKLLKSVSFTPYVIYRVVLGIILLAIAYG